MYCLCPFVSLLIFWTSEQMHELLSVFFLCITLSSVESFFFFLFHVAFPIICFLILSSVGSNLLSKCSILISSYCICLTCRSYICFCFHICYIIFIACLLKLFLSLSFISLDLANIVVLKSKVCLLIVIHGSRFPYMLAHLCRVLVHCPWTVICKESPVSKEGGLSLLLPGTWGVTGQDPPVWSSQLKVPGPTQPVPS